MKANDVDINKVYWSTRHKSTCIVAAKAGPTEHSEYLVYVVLRNKEDSGWIHCSELEEITFQVK